MTLPSPGTEVLEAGRLPLRRSLVAKLTFYVGLTLALLIAVLLSAGYHFGREILREEIDAHLSSVAASRRDMVLAHISQLKQRAELMAEHGQFRGLFHNLNTGEPDAVNRKHSQGRLNAMVEGGTVFSAFLADAKGRVVLASKGGAEEGTDVAGYPAFEKAMTGPHVGHPRWVDDHYEVVLSAPILTYAAPQRVAAVLIMTADVSALGAAVRDTTGLGQTGEVLLAIRDGENARFLFPPRHRPDVTAFPLANVPAVAAALAGQHFLGTRPDYRGVPVLAAGLPIGYGGWALVAKIDEQEAYAPIARMLRDGLFCGAAASLAGLLAAYLLARGVTRPVRRLVHAAARVAEGDYETPVPIKSADELGVLSARFNEMTAAIRARRAEREQAEAALQTRVTEAAKGQQLLLALAKSAPADLDEALREIARTAAALLRVERAGVWLLSPDGGTLRCPWLYTATGGTWAEGPSLPAAAFPDYIAALSAKKIVAAADVIAHPATRAFTEPYLKPLGIGAMLDAPLWRGGRLAGVLCHEHVGGVREWSQDEEALASALAEQATKALEEHDRKRAEAALRERTERYELVVAGAGSAIWDWDVLNKRVFYSPQWRLMRGYAEDELSDSEEEWSSRIHPEDAPRVLAAIRAHVDGESADFAEEYRIECRDGSWKWVFDRGVCQRDGTGQAVRMAGSETDITERKQAEAALRESEERYRSLFNSIDEGFCIIEVIFDQAGKPVDYRFLAVNPSFEKQTGLQDATGKRMRELAPTLEAHWFEIYGKVALTGEPVRFVNEAKQLDSRWFDVYACRLGGRESRKVAILFNNITERKQAEAALRESEERLRMITDLVPHAVFAKDSQGRFIFANRALAAGFCMLPEEVLGRTDQELLADRREAASFHKSDLAVIESGAQVFIPEEPFTSPDGRTLIFQTTKVPFTVPGTLEPAVLGVAVDITARKEAEEEIRRLNASLEQRVTERTAELDQLNRDMESFSYSVSHDLRAPLRAVNGYSRMLFHDYAEQLDAEGRRLLEVVSSEGERMGLLIDALLAFSRLGRRPITATAVDMTALAREAFDEATAEEPGKKAEFRLEDLPPAQGDPTLLRQVFANLFSNAVKFTRPREHAVIEAGARPEEGQTVYWVRDNGAGFDPRHADQLFGVFQRLHRQDEFAGSGVGLAFVQRIIQRHAGRIWAEGKPGEGATFYFTLRQPEAPPHDQPPH